MFNIFRVWLVALGVLLSGQSFAVDYYWYLNGAYNPSPNSFPDPTTACQAANFSSLTSSGWSVTFDHIEQYSLTVYRCWYKASLNGQAPVDKNYANANRAGSTCPPDTVYNSSTGLCDAPEQSLCEQAQGASTTYTVQVQFASSPPPDTVDVNGCLATFGGVMICGNQTDGTATCTGTATITGEETGGSTPIAGPATECTYNCTADFPQTESSELPCEPTTDPATGASVCTSESHFSEPGTMTCGTANGKLVCSENPKSRSQDKITEQTTTTSTNSDGSTSSSTTTTTSTTNCVGINGCTSSTKTETTSGGTNADGSPKPDATTCTGDACSAPEDLPEDEAASDLPSGDLTAPGERGNFADELAEMDQAIADSRADLRGKLDQMAELVTAQTQLSLSEGGGQLSCQIVPIAALGSSIEICFSEYEDELANLRWIILFLAAVLAFYIIFLR